MDMENDIVDDCDQSDMNLDTDLNNSDNYLLSEFLDLGGFEPSISALREESDDDRAYRILRLCRRIWGSRRIVSLRQMVADSESGGENEFDSRINLGLNENDEILETEPENIGGEDDEDVDDDEEDNNDEDDDNDDPEDEQRNGNIEMDNEKDENDDVDEDEEEEGECQDEDDDDDDEEDEEEDSDEQLRLGISENLTSEMALLLAQLVAESGQSIVNGQESLIDQLGINFSEYRSFLNRPQRTNQNTNTTTTASTSGTNLSVTNSLTSTTQTTVSSGIHEAQVHESYVTPSSSNLQSNTFRTMQREPRTVTNINPSREWQRNDVMDEENIHEQTSDNIQRQETNNGEEGIDINQDLLDIEDAQEGLDMWAFSDNLEEDVLFTLALQLSLRDQGGPGTRDNVEVNDQQSGDTSCLQSVSQEVVSLPGNENADHTEQPNNEQNSSECSQLDHATSWSAEPNVSDTVRYLKIFF
ncbi:unnamed protein product [Schistosoma mattheei]|uniref:Uncharacterized protein n=1 Tax=Schistosoma mattheei TaxID=31246 RepID=A0A183NK89_9TREM|nr:unnamed protein product [Schistosoma mattheei]